MRIGSQRREQVLVAQQFALGRREFRSDVQAARLAAPVLNLHGGEIEVPSSPSTPASNSSLGKSDNRTDFEADPGLADVDGEPFGTHRSGRA